MAAKRNIGEEILKGLSEIKAWQQGEKKLKTTHLRRTHFFGRFFGSRVL